MNVKVDGLEKVARLLGTRLAPAIRAGAVGIAQAIQHETAPYPSPRPRKQVFASEKQRRGFFARLHSGAIHVPYRRTGDVAAGWKITTQEMSAILSNAAPGAVFVHGSPPDVPQAAYHKGNWTSAAVGIVRAKPQFQSIMAQAVKKALRG